LKRFDIVYIPVNQLKKTHWNYKQNDTDLSEKLLNNIKNNGQIENLIVRELGNSIYEVINGNHRLDVINKLNIKEAACINLGKITETQAKRIAIETNETKFEKDIDKFAIIINELQNEFDINELLQTIPLSEDDFEVYSKIVDNMVNDITVNTNTENFEYIQKTINDNVGIKQEIVCKHCNKIFTI
jgi:hypothetical protein